METLVMERTRHEEMPHGALYSVKSRRDSKGNLIEMWVKNDGNRADTVLKVTPRGRPADADSWLLQPANGYKGDDTDLDLWTDPTTGKEYISIFGSCHEVIVTQQKIGGELVSVQTELSEGVIKARMDGAAGDAVSGANGRGADHNRIMFQRQPTGSRPLYKRVTLL